MANFSLVVNSKFNPFSFERYIQPYQIYGQAYREVEDTLGELDTKASVWEEMANEQTDPYAYKRYKTYTNDLKEKAGQLAKEGLNAASRRDMLNMRARYSKEITPIESAYKKREEDIARQKKVADATGGRTVFTRDARTTSLDKYMEGIDDYGQTNIDELYKEGAAGGNAISKRYLSTREGQLFNGMYLNLQRTAGMTNDQIQQFLSNQKDAKGNLLFPELHALKNELLSKSNYQNYSVADQNRMGQAILSGINTGIVYNVEDKPVENWRAKMAAQEAMQKRAEERAAARQAAEQKQAQLNNLAINPLNIYSSRELSKDEKSMKEYSKYFYKDSHGQMRMTYAGWKEYNRNATPRVTSAGSGSGTARLMNVETQMQNGSKKFTPTTFRQFMDNLGAYKVTKGKWQPGNLGNVWGRYVNSSAGRTSRYDTTRVTEYDYPIAGAQQGDMKDAIMTAGRGLSLKEVDYDSKSKEFKDTGEKITMEDLKSDKYKVTATRFSPYGATVMIQDNKGNVRRYRMPAGINTTNEQNRDRAMTAANQWQHVVSTGKYTDARGNVHQATPDEITHAQQQYANSIQQAYLFHSQLGVQNKTKEQEFNPYGY